ncbi:MAG TPA: hypothetical protein VH196_08865, partial [Terriglobales bacterium]|nr:hypothetical protein [Terriglobales bacterium]
SVSDGSNQHGNVLAMAELQGAGSESGLRDFLAAQILQSKSPDNIHLLSPDDLAHTSQSTGRDLYVLITHTLVAASPYVSTLAEVNNRWQSGGASGFAQSDFGKRIASEYQSGTGAGLLVAVNLGEMAADHAVSAQADQHQGMLEASGFANAKYLIAQRKDYNGKASNTAELSFRGSRTGVASWLAAPNSIGALDFITPNAAAVAAFVSKNPAAMVDDLMQIISRGNPNAANSWAKNEAELNLSIRNDLAASLGGDAAVALDGPLLPTPSWKLIVEVYDPSRLQYSIGRLVDAVNRNAAQNNRAGVKLDEQKSSGRTFYSVRSQDPSLPMEVHYAFVDGYVVAAASEELVKEAISTHQSSGDKLSRSGGFLALFPSDKQANVSGLIYQNLAPVIAPIAGLLSASQLQSMQALVANSEPSLICAYGGESEIELASNSKSLGLNLKALAISALLDQVKSGTHTRVTP